jgi:hypothetical protein
VRAIDQRQPVVDPVVSLCKTAKRMWLRMDQSYSNASAALRDHPHATILIVNAQTAADDLGQQYEKLCDQICKTEARTVEGVLAKLQCAAQCIRDIVPQGTDAEQACDIELRFVFAVERDVRRLVAEVRRSKARSGAAPRNRETSSNTRGRPLGDAGTIRGRSRHVI